MQAISLVLIILFTAIPAVAQVDEARQALDRGENVRAVNILSDALANRPTADVYLYLGIAYGRMEEYEKAEDALNEGSKRYPQDARFHNQLADLFLANNDTEAAKAELRRALAVDPNNNQASDLLATIDMSEGDVQSALRSWNRSGRPVIDDILHNYYLTFGSRVVRKAVAFHPSGVLHYDEWKTTESRLLETDNFANVGLEVEPTTVPDQYNAVVRTATKTNSLADFLFNLLKGAPVDTSYVDVWNIGNSGINFNGSYRWNKNRRRAEGQIKIPIPLPGLLHLEIGNTWRSERWDLSPSIRPESKPRARFDYKANTMRIHLKQIPHYRVQLGAGFEYRNRAAKGDLPELSTDSTNTGKFSVETNFRLLDGGYQNRLHLEAFAARRSIAGDAQFTGAIAELDNRVTLSKDTRTYLNWTVKTGTARGRLPVEDYFVLGLDTHSENLLRGHTAADHGRYGRGPMGTDFVLVNTDIDRRLATIPLFNTLNIPFLTVKWELFFDGAKTWDRNRIFQQGKLLLDTGGGLRFETPTHSFNLIYGRSLHDAKNVFFAYYERRLW
jgi:tetratricopeptide (TPR) repeat protein